MATTRMAVHISWSKSCHRVPPWFLHGSLAKSIISGHGLVIINHDLGMLLKSLWQNRIPCSTLFHNFKEVLRQLWWFSETAQCIAALWQSGNSQKQMSCLARQQWQWEIRISLTSLSQVCDFTIFHCQLLRSTSNYFGTSASRGVSASTGRSFWFDGPQSAGWIKRMRMAHQPWASWPVIVHNPITSMPDHGVVMCVYSSCQTYVSIVKKTEHQRISPQSNIAQHDATWCN